MRFYTAAATPSSRSPREGHQGTSMTTESTESTGDPAIEATTGARRLGASPNAYDPQATEQRLYEWWERNGYFKPRPNVEGRRFVISMHPPNVTGALHLGHALTATLEDLMVSYHR